MYYNNNSKDLSTARSTFWEPLNALYGNKKQYRKPNYQIKNENSDMKIMSQSKGVQVKVQKQELLNERELIIKKNTKRQARKRVLRKA